jgi:hypothetical protein
MENEDLKKKIIENQEFPQEFPQRSEKLLRKGLQKRKADFEDNKESPEENQEIKDFLLEIQLKDEKIKQFEAEVLNLNEKLQKNEQITDFLKEKTSKSFIGKIEAYREFKSGKHDFIEKSREIERFRGFQA